MASYATLSTEASGDRDLDGSESEVGDSESSEGPMRTEAPAPPPFLYPVPHTMAAQVQAEAVSAATPRARTFNESITSEHPHMQTTTYLPSPIRTTFARPPTQRNFSRRTPMGSQVGTPMEHHIGSDYFAFSPRQMQKLSAMSQAGRPEQGPDSVPLTPSAIAYRRSSTVGMPTMWMTSHSNAPSAATTPTAASFAQRAAGTAANPSMYFAAPGFGMSSVHSSRNNSPRMSRHPKLENSPTASNFRLDPAPAGPLWKRRMEYKHPSKTVYGFQTKDDELAEEQELAEQEDSMPSDKPDPMFALPRKVTPMSSRRSSLKVMDGMEKLPPYTCTVHVEGYLPRKMELMAPGQPARDRGWESLYFVLHGTVLHVYKTDISLLYTKTVTPETVWGLTRSPHVHTVPLNESLHEDEMSKGEELDKRDAVAHMNTGTGLEALISKSLDVKSFSHSMLSSSSTSDRSVKPTTSHLSDEELTQLIHKTLQEQRIHSYSMERAQCGLAADYTKRQHVVRLKIAGEQFLIQTRNNFHVVDWIEAIQTSANVCMDLDSRPMPSFITLPRRRRRRHGGEAVSLNHHNHSNNHAVHAS
ncbi:hypothetical protein MNAN1_001664 [Malassezia nana]|uniref:PH domain-containing protein n=1 Tax=Malassezia nana TaxID=180528 RepID=A0AAF0J289_9BASI|nr:hypothetical protein MNAN1_001664 [Malassezia nana]